MSGTGGRSILASVVGWLIVVVLAWFLFAGVFGTVWFILRTMGVLIVVGVLLTLYFSLRSDD